MDNRRPTGGRPDNPTNRGSYYKKTGDGAYAQKPFQPARDRFAPRDERAGSRDEKYPPRENRFSAPRENNRFQPRDDNKFQGRDGKFQPRDSKFQPRGERFQSNDTRNPRRDERRDNQSDSRDDRFAPRRNFAPHGVKPVPPWKKIEKPRIYDEMQITDGKHVGKFLKSTASPKVRPTARRVRETLFKLIFRRVRAGRFLDLCAGSGAVGVEAISRGALICSFVERSAKMCGFIKKNLDAMGIKKGHGEIFEIEVVPFLKQMAKRRRFWDVIYFDPPYDADYDEVLSYLGRGVCLKPHGTLVIEHPSEMFFPERLGVLDRWRVVVIGETALSFYERK